MTKTKVLLGILICASFVAVMVTSSPGVQQQVSGGGGSSVGGQVASGGSNSGNPVKIGGPFNTTQPTVTNGQMVDVQLTSRGAQIVATGADTFNVSVNAALPAGGNTIGNVNAVQSGTWNATINAALPIGGNTIGNVNSIESGTWTVQPGNTANTTPWLVKNVPSTVCGTTAVDSGLLQNVATGAGTSVFAASTCINVIHVVNTTSSAVTVTINDKSGTPIPYVNAFSLPGNSFSDIPCFYLKANGGLTVIAGTATSINAQANGYQ